MRKAEKRKRKIQKKVQKTRRVQIIARMKQMHHCTIDLPDACQQFLPCSLLLLLSLVHIITNNSN